jgi:hypothetical protein
MNNNNNDMDKFLRGSLGNLEIKPSQSVWKSVSKRLLILELARLNFTNIGKFWLYSGLATVTTIAGLSLFSINNNSSEDKISEIEDPNQITETRANSTSNISSKTSTALLDHEDAESKLQTNEAEMAIVADELNDESIEVKENDEVNQSQELHDVTYVAVTKHPEIDKSITKDEESNQVEEQIIKEDPAIIETLIVAETTDESQFKKSNPELVNEEPSKITHLKAPDVYDDERKEELIMPPQSSNRDKKPEDNKNVKQKKAKKINANKNTFSRSNENNTSQSQSKEIAYSVSFNYKHDWPLDNKEYLPQTNAFTVKGGLTWKRWDFNLGIGLQSDHINTEYEFLYSTYDSTGFFYDIDYYETIPGNPDSIIIHYTIKPIFDTVNHQDIEQKTQNSRWVVIPIEIGYQILQKKSYVLKAGISASIGWEYYRENIAPTTFPAGFNTSYQQKGPQSVSPFITLGFGLENQIKIYNKWWFIIEPQVYYHMKTPYKWENSKSSGPFGFGISTGIKFKF